MPLHCAVKSEIGWMHNLQTCLDQAKPSGAASMTADARAVHSDRNTRNPFGTIDVPDPNGADVAEFAAIAVLYGLEDDANAAWTDVSKSASPGSIEGRWASRWNGGADPTIAGDTPDTWKQGRAELRMQGDRAYLLFDWDNGRRRGLIEARRDGATGLAGKYINLTNRDIVRPWIGL